MVSLTARLLLLLRLHLQSTLFADGSTLLEVEAWVRSQRKVIPHNVAPGVAVVLIRGNTTHIFGDGVQKLDGTHLSNLDALIEDLDVPLDYTKVVDRDTLMEIGSLTKTLVGLGLATLVTKGKLSWDDPLRKWLGRRFSLGPHEYVSESLTVKDLLVHRTGLEEDQGGFSQSMLPLKEFIRNLAHVNPVHSLRSKFAYSNTGWILAGEVLRIATNSSSWCEGLRDTILRPLNLSRTFCHRNEVPDTIATAHLAAVHKLDPCSGAGHLATYDFVTTSKVSYGLSDASGSVISSASDMSRIMSLLLGVHTVDILDPVVVQEMLAGQMIVPRSWASELGILGWGQDGEIAGRAPAAGLGFDFVGDMSFAGKRFAYAEKSGDTDMHKARLGLLPGLEAGVLLLSNLGGSVGGPLTAMKYGTLTKLVGGTDAEANAATDASLNASNFWDRQWIPMNTCTACGAALSNRQCSPSGLHNPPLRLESFTGSYGLPAYGKKAISLESSESKIRVTSGAIRGIPLTFTNSSMVLQDSCSKVAATLKSQTAVWAKPELSKLAALTGSNCTLVEWIIPPEVPDAGVSASEGTVAFPYGCGIIPLPDGPSLFAVSYAGQGVLVSFLGEALPRTDEDFLAV